METTDLKSHHIEGYAQAALATCANDMDAYFKVPLISHIEGNLWMGGCIDEVELDESFVHVISLYPWERYDIGPKTTRAEFKMYDSSDVPPPTRIYAMADYVNACLLEGKTLVHCQAGLNRSGLITAQALILRDMEPEQAIELLREKRHPLVLCNDMFEDWLLGQR